MFEKIGQALYPIGHGLGKALGFDMFTPEDVKGSDVEGAPNYLKGSIYGVSVTHVIVGLVIGVLVAVPLGLVKPKIKYRRARTRTAKARKR